MASVLGLKKLGQIFTSNDITALKSASQCILLVPNSTRNSKLLVLGSLQTIIANSFQVKTKNAQKSAGLRYPSIIWQLQTFRAWKIL